MADPLVGLFEGSKFDPEEEVARLKLNLFNLLRLYTKALEAVPEEHLRNHISYWLVVSVLIEKHWIEELDGEYLNYCTEVGEEPEAFFLLENSLKLLCRYLRKLHLWYNESIFLFYFQLLNLYYYYDIDRTCT